ncbi:Histidine kinase-, DNA gyrase B-, and HSP90-like ATPase-like protein 5 [Elsinoe fawcettii]|nr:Histidine kinase-, DNA gyrase B-, and HSP90-like ATPase-like protein 5 [Elsinoe fawcettii]
MRIPIREQLAALLLLASGIGLGVIAIATWYTNYSFVLGVRGTRLAISASLKASQLASNLALLENSVQFTASRIVVQDALRRYNEDGDNSQDNWSRTIPDMAAAIGGPASGGAVGRSLLLQSQIRPRTNTGPAGSSPVLNTTSAEIIGRIKLPYSYPNGTDVYLGDEGLGFPPALYPNFTYSNIVNSDGVEVATADYQGDVISPLRNQALLLGPWQINSTFSMLSITLPIINNTSSLDVLGWLTVVMDGRLITNVINMQQGLDQTGRMLLIRPVNNTNQYPPGVMYDSGPDANIYNDQDVRFVLPLNTNASDRHATRVQGTSNPPFKLGDFPALVQAVTKNQNAGNNAGNIIRAQNEEGLAVSCGFALVSTPFVDWAVIVEQSRSEVWTPITRLRTAIIACVFGTLGAMALIAWPLAHFASLPIRQLKLATAKTVMPAGYTDSSDTLEGSDYEDDDGAGPQSNEADAALARKEGFFASVLRRRKRSRSDNTEERRRRHFRIPGKVPDRKHIVKDELSELTTTFNEMSDELMMQYERLEERVRTRTAELELSKKAAEAANESKTLFIANISHELKTPLNGILGMCAVCMQEDDPIRLKRSLGIIYKSGDLLLNLLTDLLTFSKNQVGQQLSLDEKEFRLRDISSQVLAIFDKQAKDNQIDLSVQFQNSLGEIEGKDAVGNRVKDMILWGDTHRILQVIINLVSNSLKFTPAQGKVTLTVRCLGESSDIASRKTSLGSRTSRRNRNRLSDLSGAPGRTSGSEGGSYSGGAFQRILEVDRATPPPGKTFMFEFEVVDTGPGIPEHLHQRIFEPFVQGDLGLSKKYGGTGLGLSICSQLAGLMHGAMSLQSEVGQGSTFMMRIPLRHLLSRADSTASSNVSQIGDNMSVISGSGGTGDAFGTPKRRSIVGDNVSVSSFPGNTGPSSPPQPQKDQFEQSNQPRLVGLSQPFFASAQPMESPGSQPAAMEQMKVAASSAGKIRVLVAEDNKVNQEVVLRMLKLEDIYDVTVAKDGQEALDFVKESMSTPDPDDPNSLASKGPFNLIFMDVQMPNLDGLQSTKLIRETGFDKPIVALTAFAEESNVKDCLDSGMNYFLSKPIRRPALKKVLKEYCAPIMEEDEGQPSPTEKRTDKSATASLGGSTVVDVKGKGSLGTVASQDIDTKTKRSSTDGIDLGMHNTGNTTVVVLSRPNSAEIPRK